MSARIFRMLRDEDGATAIEYGLIAALIAVAAVTSFQAFGGGLSNMWDSVSTTMENQAPS